MGWYGTWAQSLSYYAPSHFENAAPRRPQLHVKCHFDKTNRRGFQEKVDKQVYRVKRDNHKDKSSDLSSSDTKPNVTITTSTNIGMDMKQQVGDAQGAKCKPMEFEVSKVERKFPMPKSEAQPSHPLGLPNWQIRKLQKLNAEELKVKNMAWVPKQSVQVHGMKDNEIKGTKETKRRRAIIHQVRGLHQIIRIIGLHIILILHQHHPCLYCGVCLQVCLVTPHGLVLIL
jgi:hypothetical protein